MKKLLFIPFAFGLSFCKCPQSTVSKTPVTTIESVCPENGKCSIQIFKNKSLEVKEDNFGSIYYVMNDNTMTSVILYEYKRNVEDGVQDGQHREEVVFEIPNKSANQNHTDKMLQNTKMLFGRYCNCRGKNGLFKVNQGKLHITSSKKEVRFKLQFKINEVPQVTEEIEY